MTKLSQLLAGGSESRVRALRQRIGALADGLGIESAEAVSGSALSCESFLDGVLGANDKSRCWLVLSVLGARFPVHADVERLHRAIYVGCRPAEAVLSTLDHIGVIDSDNLRRVEVSSGVLVDVDHTARYPLSTGIQRVVREVVRRWTEVKDVTLVAWTFGFDGLRRLDAIEANRAVGDVEGDTLSLSRCDEGERPVIVPWHGRIIVPELFSEVARATASRAVFEFSQSQVGMVGFDCVPMTMSETTGEGMPVGFMHMLAAARYVHRVAAISDAAASEFRGWRSMLSSTGLLGPDVASVPLAVSTYNSTQNDVDHARGELGLGQLPIVLAVGSHEPRKNHMVVLHAAELLWRDGVRFALAFIGGHSWKADAFLRRVRELSQQGLPVIVVERAPEPLLWAAYRIATVSVSVSLQEGYGLPVAESLACGTPVVTSNFGAMVEQAVMGGCIQVEPRSPDAVARGIRSVLTDPSLRSKLSNEALRRPSRSWDQYAEELWTYLVDGVPPD